MLYYYFLCLCLEWKMYFIFRGRDVCLNYLLFLGYFTATFCSGEVITLPTGSCFGTADGPTGFSYGMYSTSGSTSITLTYYSTSSCTSGTSSSQIISISTASCASAPINGLTFTTSKGFPFPPTSKAGIIEM